jgi:hypothetical protein
VDAVCEYLSSRRIFEDSETRVEQRFRFELRKIEGGVSGKGQGWWQGKQGRRLVGPTVKDNSESTASWREKRGQVDRPVQSRRPVSAVPAPS